MSSPGPTDLAGGRKITIYHNDDDGDDDTTVCVRAVGDNKTNDNQTL